jgi:4a-hydroxytetrahydrobiopterin dehydratase
MNALAEMEFKPCRGDVKPLTDRELTDLTIKLGGEWMVMVGHHLEREYAFKNFRDALAFTDRVGDLAEKMGHHPDIYLAWGKVRLTLWTHKIDGLTKNDFVLAAKINQLLPRTERKPLR